MFRHYYFHFVTPVWKKIIYEHLSCWIRLKISNHIFTFIFIFPGLTGDRFLIFAAPCGQSRRHKELTKAVISIKVCRKFYWERKMILAWIIAKEKIWEGRWTISSSNSWIDIVLKYKCIVKLVWDNCHYFKRWPQFYSWWRHQMETFSVLLALCEGFRWIPLTKASDVELWYFRWSEQKTPDTIDEKLHRMSHMYIQ